MNYSDPRVNPEDPRITDNFQIKNNSMVRVLDHGFVKLHNISGPTRRINQEFDADDTDPANTARMSFENMDMDRTREMDLKSCNYLMKNMHTTPFEMIEIWLEMKLPIFVARQFVRHRTCTINEVSARYVKLPEEFYIPEIVGKAPEKAKQGQTIGLMPHVAEQFKEWLTAQCKDSYMKYSTFIDQKVAPEHARMFLHLNHYTHWMWKQDLHNMMHFLSLRADSHAQVEAQAYANAIITLIRTHLPESMKLFDEYRRLHAPVLGNQIGQLKAQLESAHSDARSFHHAAIQAHEKLAKIESEFAGPSGFATWKDAAFHERKKRVELEEKIDQLTPITKLLEPNPDLKPFDMTPRISDVELTEVSLVSLVNGVMEIGTVPDPELNVVLTPLGQLTNTAVAAIMTLDEEFPTFEETPMHSPKPAYKMQCPTGPDMPIYPDIVANLKKSGVAIADFMVNNSDAADLLHMAVGVTGEVIELIEGVNGYPLGAQREDNIREELGDIEFFLEGLKQIYNKNCGIWTPIEWEARPYVKEHLSVNQELNLLLSAAGNVLDAVKRISIYENLDRFNTLSSLLHTFKWQLDDVYIALEESRDYAIDANMYKLVYSPKARYAGGKFSNKAANERVDKQ